MTTHPFDNTRPDHEGRTASASELTTAAEVLRLRGHEREARSLEIIAKFLSDYAGEEVVHAGLSALLTWARRETTDPLLVRVGDRVRVTRHNGPVIATGVWMHDADGRPLVQRDDDGEDLRIYLDRHRVELLYLDLGSRSGQWTGALWNAGAVVRSAWLPRTSRHLDDEQQPENEQERDARERYEQRRRHERLCDCGTAAEWRVIAWTEREAVELDASGFPWHEPATYGSETVCSQACGEQWGRGFLGRAALPPDLTLAFRLEPFQYRAEHEELPLWLARARQAAVRATNVLDGAALEHVSGNPGSVDTLVLSARPAVSELLDAVLMLTTPRP